MSYSRKAGGPKARKGDFAMARNGFKVFDSDMHVSEPHDLYLKYMEPKWGDRIPRGEPRKKHGQVIFKFGDGTPIRLSGIPGRTVGPPGEAKVAERYEAAFVRNYDAVSQVEAMDREGVDVAVLFRTFPLHCDETLEPEYANALCRAWNSWISDFSKKKPEKLRPSALITLHDVDLAVAEARRAVKNLGAVALVLVPEPIKGRQIHDHYFDPLWREAERLKVPICFHPAANPNQEEVARRFNGHPNQGILVPVFRNPVELMLALGSFCAGGVLERFPNLRVAFLEGNCSWLPWLLYKLDERWDLRKEYADEPLSRKPSEYFLRQCFISVDVDEELVVDVINRLGDDNLVVSTDYPHSDSHWPHAIDSFMGIAGLSETSKRKILWDNCSRLYNQTA
jgi:uncharacterized protein